MALAREISHRICRFDGVAAIVAAGSVARGYADRYSDLEILIYWDDEPTDAVRRAIISEMNADFLREYNGPAGEDNLLVKGFQVDLQHNTVAYEETVFEDVLFRLDTDLYSNHFFDTIRSCIPLYGEALITRWKERARVYPDELAFKHIMETLVRLDVGHLEIHASRGNLTLAYEIVCELHQQLFLILLALNREYFPTYKWMYRSLNKMPIRPADIEYKFRSVFGARHDEVIRDTYTVITDTLSLVKEQFPDHDMACVSERLSLRRKPHDAPVSL
jgi:hypothetical protein